MYWYGCWKLGFGKGFEEYEVKGTVFAMSEKLMALIPFVMIMTVFWVLLKLN